MEIVVVICPVFCVRLAGNHRGDSQSQRLDKNLEHLDGGGNGCQREEKMVLSLEKIRMGSGLLYFFS